MKTTNDNSDVGDVEEEVPHHLPPELAGFFKSDTDDEDFIGVSGLE